MCCDVNVSALKLLSELVISERPGVRGTAALLSRKLITELFTSTDTRSNVWSIVKIFLTLYVCQDYDLSWRRRHVNHFDGKGVLVIRNPYKAILSYWNFKNTKSHTKTISGASLRSERFQQFAKTGAQRSVSAKIIFFGNDKKS